MLFPQARSILLNNCKVIGVITSGKKTKFLKMKLGLVYEKSVIMPARNFYS